MILLTRERLDKYHPAYGWALEVIKKDPRLVDDRGLIKVPYDAIDYCEPIIGRPYVKVNEVFLLRDGQPVIDNYGVRTWPVNVKIRAPRGWRKVRR